MLPKHRKLAKGFSQGLPLLILSRRNGRGPQLDSTGVAGKSPQARATASRQVLVCISKAARHNAPRPLELTSPTSDANPPQNWTPIKIESLILNFEPHPGALEAEREATEFHYQNFRSQRSPGSLRRTSGRSARPAWWETDDVRLAFLICSGQIATTPKLEKKS